MSYSVHVQVYIAIISSSHKVSRLEADIIIAAAEMLCKKENKVSELHAIVLSKTNVKWYSRCLHMYCVTVRNTNHPVFSLWFIRVGGKKE